jgi:uncharacterized protein (TIGR02271 family)
MTHDPVTHDPSVPPGPAVHGTATSAHDDQRGAPSEVVRSEEQLRVGTVTEQAGAVRAVKHVDVENVQTRVERGTEHAELDRTPVDDAATDSGEVETLPDGSVSIPVFEEQIVITKRLVVRERVILRKHTVYEEQVVSADLRRERLEVEAVGDAVVSDEGQARR